jgi:hypothetical protein
MPRRFRGTEIKIQELSIVGGSSGMGAKIKCRVLFMSKQGTVHGASSHEIAILKEETPELHKHAQGIVKALTERLENIHYVDGAQRQVEERKEVRRGIAEALAGDRDPADDFEQQG